MPIIKISIYTRKKTMQLTRTRAAWALAEWCEASWAGLGPNGATEMLELADEIDGVLWIDVEAPKVRLGHEWPKDVLRYRLNACTEPRASCDTA